MSVIGSNILAGASGQGGGYNLTRSLRFRSSASAYLSRTPASAGNRKTWTWSAWVKRGSIGSRQTVFAASADGNNENWITFQSGDYLTIYNYESATQYSVETTQLFRDTSAWYHIIVAFDTTQATSSNRLKIYVNGSEVTALRTTSYPSQNFEGRINNTVAHAFGRSSSAFPNYFDGYLTEVNFIDGQALTPSSFGETSPTTGVWIPKRYTGTYGTNGFYLPFSDNTSTTTLGADSSGNGNNWTCNNISLTSGVTYDSMTDVPTLTSATASNFNVLNPLSVTTGTVSAGNLQYVGASASKRINGTLAVNSGKWYWEVTLLNAPESPRSSTSAYNGFGFGLATAFDSSAGGTSSTDWINLKDNGYYKNFSNANTDTGVTFSSGDVLAIAVDLDANTFTFYRNNSSLATGTLGVTAGTQLVPAMYSYNGSFGAMACNFGQRPFAYTPPTGYVALNTFNLPTPTIGATASSQANKYFDISLWTGDGASTKTVTNSGGFQPDFVWAKQRNIAQSHSLWDSVRGTGKLLESNATGAESTSTVYGQITSFDANGFTGSKGSDATYSYLNQNTGTYVGWQWKANGTGVTNTAGSITSTVSANTTSGFSIVTYTGNGTTGATVGHGLGVAPNMVIVKERGNVNGWYVYHQSLGNTRCVYLDSTSAQATVPIWNNTTPTSSVITYSNGAEVNRNGGTYVAYCFSAVAGYSAFGSYTGNGSSDGTFVAAGFMPRYVMMKRTDSTGDWQIFDTSRSPTNVASNALYANGSFAEDSNVTNRSVDFLSNGFKIRSSGTFINASGGTFIYMAFAENPLKYSLAH